MTGDGPLLTAMALAAACSAEVPVTESSASSAPLPSTTVRPTTTTALDYGEAMQLGEGFTLVEDGGIVEPDTVSTVTVTQARPGPHGGTAIDLTVSNSPGSGYSVGSCCWDLIDRSGTGHEPEFDPSEFSEVVDIRPGETLQRTLLFDIDPRFVGGARVRFSEFSLADVPSEPDEPIDPFEDRDVLASWTLP